MRKLRRQIKHFSVCRAHLQAHPLFERRRSRPQIDADVVDCAAGAGGQFTLTVRRSLIVHASQRAALLVVREVRRAEFFLNAVRRELADGPDTREKSSLIGVESWLDDERTG